MHLQGYYSQALSIGRRDGKGGLSAQTVGHHDRVLNVDLKRARALRLIATNPVEDVSAPKVERRELRPSRHWRRPNDPDRLGQLIEGVCFRDGEAVQDTEEQVAA